MDQLLKNTLQELLGAVEVNEIEVVQLLWSGYGKISRVALTEIETNTVIVKEISLPTGKDKVHPRGWNTNRSHQRKIKSYQVETEWYKKWASRCGQDCRIPTCFGIQNTKEKQFLILEDLNASGFPVRKSSLDINGVKLGLLWLANFHANFIGEPSGNLWNKGTYWHLATRPDEYNAMEESWLKVNAEQLNNALNSCKFKTIVHGDAKVANFCFSEDMQQVSVLDFQYVGGGCGIKDVVYFLGSCLNEFECKAYESELLSFYFEKLETALQQKNKTKFMSEDRQEFIALEKEWRTMYYIAWADFIRFLKGWMPTHEKINSYSFEMVEKAKELLK